jgi:hypothetical protein
LHPRPGWLVDIVPYHARTVIAHCVRLFRSDPERAFDERT